MRRACSSVDVFTVRGPGCRMAGAGSQRCREVVRRGRYRACVAGRRTPSPSWTAPVATVASPWRRNLVRAGGRRRRRGLGGQRESRARDRGRRNSCPVAYHSRGEPPFLLLDAFEGQAFRFYASVSTRTSANFRKSRSKVDTGVFSATAVAAIRQSTKWTFVLL